MLGRIVNQAIHFPGMLVQALVYKLSFCLLIFVRAEG